MSLIGLIISIAAQFLIIGLFLYSKLYPYKNRMHPQALKKFEFIEKILEPILKLLRKAFKPTQLGQGLAIDTAQFILLIILLLLMNLFR
ncbi:MAG: YggT family protein [Bacteroidia bacterium]